MPKSAMAKFTTNMLDVVLRDFALEFLYIIKNV